MGKSADKKMREIVWDLKDDHKGDSSGEVRVSFSQLRSAIERNAGRNSRTITKYIDYLKQSGRLEEIKLEEANGYAFEISSIEREDDTFYV